MQYKITETTSISELKQILSKAGRGVVIMCENDRVFKTVVKWIDDDRNYLISHLRVEEE